MVSESKLPSGVFGIGSISNDFWIIVLIVFGISGCLIGVLANWFTDREFAKTLIKMGFIFYWISSGGALLVTIILFLVHVITQL